jgi:hypothetical protein
VICAVPLTLPLVAVMVTGLTVPDTAVATPTLFTEIAAGLDDDQLASTGLLFWSTACNPAKAPVDIVVGAPLIVIDVTWPFAKEATTIKTAKRAKRVPRR